MSMETISLALIGLGFVAGMVGVVVLLYASAAVIAHLRWRASWERGKRRRIKMAAASGWNQDEVPDGVYVVALFDGRRLPVVAKRIENWFWSDGETFEQSNLIGWCPIPSQPPPADKYHGA